MNVAIPTILAYAISFALPKPGSPGCDDIKVVASRSEFGAPVDTDELTVHLKSAYPDVSFTFTDKFYERIPADLYFELKRSNNGWVLAVRYMDEGAELYTSHQIDQADIDISSPIEAQYADLVSAYIAGYCQGDAMPMARTMPPSAVAPAPSAVAPAPSAVAPAPSVPPPSIVGPNPRIPGAQYRGNHWIPEASITFGSLGAAIAIPTFIASAVYNEKGNGDTANVFLAAGIAGSAIAAVGIGLGVYAWRHNRKYRRDYVLGREP